MKYAKYFILNGLLIILYFLNDVVSSVCFVDTFNGFQTVNFYCLCRLPIG